MAFSQLASQIPQYGNRIPKALQASHTKLSIGHLLAFSLLLPTIRYLYIDYQKFLSLGPGGTPKTFFGYFKVKMLSMFALSNPYEPPVIPSYMGHKSGCLTSLLQREGRRPSTMGIAPHRQTDQMASPELFAKLSAAISAIADDNVHLEEGTSCFEKHGTGLFSDYPKRRTCRGEICHAHPSDGSMHLTLHPSDAKIAIEAGWGERHPLARGGWLERFVPGGFLMIYAPRNDGEIDTLLEIIRASVWWVGSEDIKGPEETRRDSGFDTEAGKDVSAFEEAKESSSIQANQHILKA